MRLALIHQSPGVRPLPSGAIVWRTCLRELAFVDHAVALAADHGIVTDADAYALLVEVVSGLRSPLAGETEVQAQFKAFLASLDPVADGDLLSLGQRVLADARFIRRTHLQGVTVDAYGDLVARRVPAGRRVALVGTGALGTAIRTTLAARHRIDHWARRPPDGGDGEGYYLLSTAASRPIRAAEPASLVVAAPASQPDIDAVAGCYSHLMDVIDLRASDHRTPVPATTAQVVTLDDLFRDRAPAAHAERRVAAARGDVARLARAFACRESVRPFGWDDLCA